jgi:hypothetical protein
MIIMARTDPRLDLLIHAHDGRGLGHARRDIIGQVTGVWSRLAATIFKKYYSALLGYGDESVLGQ